MSLKEKYRAGTLKWQTRVAENIPVENLEEDHIKNILTFLQEKIDKGTAHSFDFCYDWIDILLEELHDRKYPSIRSIKLLQDRVRNEKDKEDAEEKSRWFKAVERRKREEAGV